MLHRGRPLLAVAFVAVLLATAAPVHAAPDRDGDGLDDRQERQTTKTDPRSRDSDGDGLSDGFEVRWGVTDPNRRDSDSDGIHDALEDEDQDHLSNRGEQRFKTDPSAFDSDLDGIKDGGDDANENGVRDALEQDARKVPPGARGSVAAARNDFVNDRNGCHTNLTSGYIYSCVYGNTAGRTNVALFGDSHALQWLPALDRAGETHGWRVTSLTKSACPAMGVPINKRSRLIAASCRRWRNNAKAWLKAHPQDVVVIANSGRYTLLDKKGKRLSAQEREKRWSRGLAQTLRAIPKRTKVLVLADTPRFVQDPQICLLKKGNRISDCQTRRAAAILQRHNDVWEGVADRLGAKFGDLNPAVCPYDPCPLLTGNTMMWRDNGHLTETFSRQLAPAMHRLVRSTMKRKAQPSLGPAPSSGLADATASVVVHQDFFEPDVIEAQSGVELEVLFTNVGRSPHRISFFKDDGEEPTKVGSVARPIRKGHTAEITFSDPEPGEYTFVSSEFPEGNTGTLIIR